MKQVVQWLVLALSLFCLATPFNSSEAIPGQPNKGEIDFEMFRQISTGMTKEEVLNLAGQPAERYDPRNCEVTGQCLERWVYYYYDNWVTEISFWSKTGRVANINSHRRQ